MSKIVPNFISCLLFIFALSKLNCEKKAKSRQDGAGIQKMKRVKNKIFYSYLISYILIGIFPLFLSLLGYKVCQNIIVEEIKISQDNLLTQAQRTFDHYVDGMVINGQLLAGNVRLNELAAISEFGPQDRLEIKKLRDELEVQKNSLELCGEIDVYFQKSGVILTDSKAYPEKLSHIYEKEGGITGDSLQKALEVPGIRGYVVGEDQKGSPQIIFVENVYNYNYKEKAAVIAIVMPWEKVRQKTGSIKGGTLFWVNGAGDCLVAGEQSEPVMMLPAEALEQENTLIYSGKGKDAVISSIKNSQYYDWKYCITMSQKYYFAELNRLQIVIIVQMILLIVVALMLALFYSWKNYKPIDRILSAVKKNQRSGTQPTAFSDVEKYIEDLYLENQKLGNSWEKARNIVAGQVIKGYLKGWNSDETLVEETLAEQSGIRLNEQYMVFLITLNDISQCRLFTKAEDVENGETRELLHFIFSNFFGEAVLSKHRGVLFPMDDLYLCILQQGEKSTWEAAVEDMIQCSNLYRSYLNLSVFIGSSSRHAGVEELRKAYSEAAQVLSYQAFWGNEKETLIIYENTFISGSIYEGSDLLYDKQRKLYNLMASREYEKAGELLDDMIDSMFIRDIGYTEVNQCRMSGLINTVCMNLTEILGRNDEAFLYELHPMDRLLQIKSVDSAKSRLREIFSDVVTHLQECLEDEKPKWIEEVKKDVEIHYGDVTLSISTYAEKMNMNLAYMGRAFKQHTGYSLPDYIHLVRIRECKKLLREGVSVKDAAEMVGYVDSKSLIRIFKKQEGITPGQYKNGQDVES